MTDGQLSQTQSAPAQGVSAQGVSTQGVSTQGPPTQQSSVSPVGLDLLRGRVRLFLQITLFFDLLALLGDVLGSVGDLTYPDVAPYTKWLRGAVTLSLLGSWSLVRFATLRRRTLVLVESVVTVWMSWAMVFLTVAFTENEPYLTPILGLVGVLQLIVIRAALVPSPAWRTALVGLLSMVGLYTGTHRHLDELAPHVSEGVLFMAVAFIMATAATSRVVYQLRRQVRDMTKLGQYTLGEKLGEGGMGAVYRGQHAMLRREAAIKVVKSPEGEGEAAAERHRQAQQRFEREAQVTAGLKSAHTVQLYDFGMTEDGAFYYVMELLHGLSLERAVKQYGPMPAARVVYILRQVCDSLAEAHAVGLIHRDIKPANLLLCRHGVRYDFMKVLDFGLVALTADTTRDETKLTHDGVVAGTPAYIAPEMVTESSPLDHRADLYALGAVAYWLLTGDTVFHGRSAMAMMLAHVNETPTPPSELVDAVPPALEALILQCLSKRPEDRPESAAALSDALLATLDDHPWTPAQAERWWRQHRPQPIEPGTLRSSKGPRTVQAARAR